MLDRLMVRRAIGRNVLVDPNYSPDNAVLGYSDNGFPESRNLAVIFPSWHLHLDDPSYRFFAWNLGRQGFAIRRYDFSDNILEPNAERVPKSFHNIQDTVVEDLDILADKKSFRSIHFIAWSLGTVSMALVASQFERMTSATIIAGSSNLALSMWYGTRTAEVRRTLEETGHTRNDINDAWHDIAPITHASAFRDRPVRQDISITDTIIPTTFQLEMSYALKAAGSQLDARYTELGHYAAIGKYIAESSLS